MTPPTVDDLRPWTREAQWQGKSGDTIYCELCPHECFVEEGERGKCHVRMARGGQLQTLVYGNACALSIDPMEKKPLYHFLPGRPILSVATAGCNLKCLNCQNWQLSQSLPENVRYMDLPPEKLVRLTEEKQVPAIAYTYGEPIIYYEYMHDTAVMLQQKGIKNVMVTAGYINEAPMRKLARLIDAANVDLKSCDKTTYKRLNRANLEPVLNTLKLMREEGIWLEITRLIVPQYTDSMDDIRRQCEWIIDNLGRDTPLHISRFHPAYQLKDLPPTPLEVMEAAEAAARESGLHYVYVGNVPTRQDQHTRCPQCDTIVIHRQGYSVGRISLNNGCCPSCGKTIAGIWN